jgi:membrane protease YdiL (CAAX protease family)
MDKKMTRRDFLEPLILFCVLFLPSLSLPALQALAAPKVLQFSVIPLLNHVFVYAVPALALIWYLLLRGGEKWPRPGIQDLKCAVFALLALGFIGFACAFAAHIRLLPEAPKVERPAGFAAILAALLTCVVSAYLEESYFRYYLFLHFTRGGLTVRQGALISSLLFAFCHGYEGLSGFLNALAAGFALWFLFSRFRSLHGLAWAHGAYNICALLLS